MEKCRAFIDIIQVHQAVTAAHEQPDADGMYRMFRMYLSGGPRRQICLRRRLPHPLSGW